MRSIDWDFSHLVGLHHFQRHESEWWIHHFRWNLSSPSLSVGIFRTNTMGWIIAEHQRLQSASDRRLSSLTVDERVDGDAITNRDDIRFQLVITLIIDQYRTRKVAIKRRELFEVTGRSASMHRSWNLNSLVICIPLAIEYHNMNISREHGKAVMVSRAETPHIFVNTE